MYNVYYIMPYKKKTSISITKEISIMYYVCYHIYFRRKKYNLWYIYTYVSDMPVHRTQDDIFQIHIVHWLDYMYRLVDSYISQHNLHQTESVHML
jgi:hypothetical protein